MKGLGGARGRFLSDSCDLTGGAQEPLYPLYPLYPHPSYLLSPAPDPYGTLDSPFFFSPSSPTSLPPEGLVLPLANSAPFPCVPYGALDPGGGGGGIGGGVRTAAAPPPVSTGTGQVISSGSATISGGGTAGRLSANQPEGRGQGGGVGGGAGPRQQQRDGFSTLQFQRGRVSAAPAASKPRGDSPGRIRHLMHSVHRLFAKSQSLESSAAKASTVANGNAKGRRGRSKSKDRAKTEGPARRPRSGVSGLWGSADDLDSAPAPSAGAVTTAATTTTARCLPEGYGTVGSGRALRASRSSGELKFSAAPPPAATPPGGEEGGKLTKRDSWSSLTLSQARQMCQKGLATLDRSLLKSKSCHQDLAYHYLQVPLGDWSSTLGPSRGSREIPCRRMRSGSYVKAMGDLGDSEDSEGSPKPSPKTAARRQSYLRATQHSLSEQLPPHNCWDDFGLLQEDLGPLWPPLWPPLHRLGSCLPSLSELSTNRSLDNLDSLGCIDGPLSSPFQPDGPIPSPFQLDGPIPSPFQPDGPIPSPFQPDGPIPSPFQPDGPIPSPFQLDGPIPSPFQLDGPIPSPFQLDGPIPSPFQPDGPVLSPFQPWDQMDSSQGFGTLGRANITGQAREQEPPYRQPPYRQPSYQKAVCALPPMPPLPPLRPAEPLDLPLASCFRSRSQSYLRAIHAGVSQDEESADSATPPPATTTTTVHTNSSATTSTCVTTSKKAPPLALPPAPAPPPVPPRSASKPFISVTVQSSTESAQDTYLDGPADGQSGRGGDPPVAPPRNEALKSSAPPAAARPDPLPKRKLSSIGIQVDSDPAERKQETPPLTRFQSIGVQVEDSWQQGRPGAMATRREPDPDVQDPPKNTAAPAAPLPAPSTAHGRPPRPLTHRTSSASFSEALDPALDPSSLPPPDPWLESGGDPPAPGPAPGASSACRRDGHWFLKLLQAETARMEGWCQQMEQETKDNQLSEEVLGKIRSAMGSAQLLMSQKFQQFHGLCDQNLNLGAGPRPTAQDLAGFWDLLQLSIEDISLKFDELYHLKSNDWQLAHSPEKKKEEKKQPPPVPKKPSKAKVAATREKAGLPDPPTDSKQRQEARKRLMAAKRAASVRQNSATESADSIEIYVPEAQTRL